jgi:hypothetical protein
MFDGLFAPTPREAAGNAVSAALKADTAAHAAAEARRQADILRFDVQKLYLITEALWCILKEKHGYSDEHLAALMQELDLRDGKQDGKSATTPERAACPNCGRTLMRRQAQCIYCGAPVPQKPFER